MAKARMSWLDLIKTVAIFMIITLHNGTWRTDFMATGEVASLLQFCARLFCEGVPIFMLINGFLMLGKPFDLKKHVKRTVNVLVILLLWSVILEVAFCLIKGQPITVDGLLGSLLETTISRPQTGVLWFLHKLFVVYLLLPIIKHLYDTRPRLYDYLLLVLMLSTFITPLLSVFADILDSALLRSVIVFLNQYSLTVGSNVYVLYFMLGGYLYRHRDTLPRKTLIAVGAGAALVSCALGIIASVATGATYAAGFNYSQGFLMFTLVGAFLLCSRLPLRGRFPCALLASTGDNTMGIYLLHKIYIWGIDALGIIPTTLLQRLGLSLVVFLLSWVTAVLIRKIPKASFLVKL